MTAADAGRSICGISRDDSASDGDVSAAGTIPTAADTCSIITASSLDGSAIDIDETATGVSTAADACSIITTFGLDVAALDDDVATGDIPCSADAATLAIADGLELAGANASALDDERLVFRGVVFIARYIDAGPIFIESLHPVRLAVGQDDGGVALAVNAGPIVVLVVFAVDFHAGERHRGAVGNHDLVGMRRAVERAGERRAVGHDDRMAVRPNERRGDVRQVAVPSVVRRRDALHLQPSRVGQRHLFFRGHGEALRLVARRRVPVRGDRPLGGILRALFHLHLVGVVRARPRGRGRRRCLRPGSRRRCQQREQGQNSFSFSHTLEILELLNILSIVMLLIYLMV